MRNLDYDPSSFYARYTQEQQAAEKEKPSDWRKKAGLLVGALAISGAFIGGIDSSPESETKAFSPEQDRITGDVDTTIVYEQIKHLPDFESRIEKDRDGTEVVRISEYAASRYAPSSEGEAFLAERLAIPNMDAGLRDNLKTVVDTNAQLLNALRSTYQLEAIRFNMAVDPDDGQFEFTPAGRMRYLESGDPAGSPDGAVIDYTLPVSGNISKEVMVRMISHEAEHIAQQPLQGLVGIAESNKRPLGKAEKNAYVNPDGYREQLSIIRKASIEAVQDDPEVIAAARQVVTLTASSKDSAGSEANRIARAVLEGTFNEMQPTQFKPSNEVDYNIDEGRTQSPSDKFFSAKLSEEEFQQLTTTQKDAINTLGRVFERKLSTSTESPLASFNEGTYFDDGNEKFAYYGHAQDNAAEAAASATNVVQSYPQKFAERIKGFSGSVKEAMLGFVKGLNKDTERAFESRGGFGADVTRLIKDRENVLSWVEENSDVPPK